MNVLSCSALALSFRLVGQEFLPIATGIQFPWKPKIVPCQFSKLKMKERLRIKGK